MFGWKNRKSNPWKKYGVIAMAAVLAAGNVPFMNPDYSGAVAYAEEKQEVTYSKKTKYSCICKECGRENVIKKLNENLTFELGLTN